MDNYNTKLIIQEKLHNRASILCFRTYLKKYIYIFKISKIIIYLMWTNLLFKMISVSPKYTLVPMFLTTTLLKKIVFLLGNSLEL